MRVHKEEIYRWANCPEGTKVWEYCTNTNKWTLVLYPKWSNDSKYVVDDKWAELRKAQADGKTIQIKFNIQYETDWEDQVSVDWTLPIESYRIKPTPVYEWQYLYQIEGGEKYYITGKHYSTRKEAFNALYSGVEGIGSSITSMEKYPPSRIEVAK